MAHQGHSQSNVDANNKQMLRDYQVQRLGRSNDETCLLELLPLPSPNTSSFIYKDWDIIPNNEDRDSYTKSLIQERIKQIRALIAQYKPKYVVMYSTDKKYIAYWQKIVAPTVLTHHAIGKKSMYIGHNSSTNTKYCICGHPTSPIPASYFHDVGTHLQP